MLDLGIKVGKLLKNEQKIQKYKNLKRKYFIKQILYY